MPFMLTFACNAEKLVRLDLFLQGLVEELRGVFDQVP